MSSGTATYWQIQVCRTENHSWQGAYLPTIVLVYAGQFHSFRGRWKHFSFGQAKYSGGIVATFILDWKMDWYGGTDYAVRLQNLHF